MSEELTDFDVYLLREGTHARLYEKLGAHCVGEGTRFSVWAPNAQRVSVIGDFNGWDTLRHPLYPRPDGSGIWECHVDAIGSGAMYKYHVVSRFGGYSVDKSDPFAFRCESPPRTASIVWPLDYVWGDERWIQNRERANALGAPWSIYELHLGSWQRTAQSDPRFLSYREIAPRLVEHVTRCGFTHVELLPIMEHPFYGSWGYQVTGYFAPSARYGIPQDLMWLIDLLHQNGVGVVLDWVPSHFPSDAHGLVYFDGTHLYEHADPQQGVHPEWGSCIFNYGRSEVRGFLLSAADFWLRHYHVDALRLDAVASMLYLDYGRAPGQWIPNRHGGNENLEAVDFLRDLNVTVYRDFPHAQTIAEESTAWPQVSRPVEFGGLGFGMKWNMGWMHDTLNYFGHDPIHRPYHHDELTFGLCYAFNENFVLSLSHDEVVYGKRSLLSKMPGDEWQKFANLRALYSYMWAHPGKKLLFMGGEFAQRGEWNHDSQLDWGCLNQERHSGVLRLIADLNRLYVNEPALHERDFSSDGFEWLVANDREASVLAFIRRGRDTGHCLVIACNFTPVVRTNYRIGAPHGGFWREVLNSDAQCYGGSGQGNLGGVEASALPFQGRAHSLTLTLPPLAVLFLKASEAAG